MWGMYAPSLDTVTVQMSKYCQSMIITETIIPNQSMKLSSQLLSKSGNHSIVSATGTRFCLVFADFQGFWKCKNHRSFPPKLSKNVGTLLYNFTHFDYLEFNHCLHKGNWVVGRWIRLTCWKQQITFVSVLCVYTVRILCVYICHHIKERKKKQHCIELIYI